MVGRGRTNRWILKLLTVFELYLLVSSSSPSSTPSKPHIIFILADDLGWYDVSWHNPKAITPNLETLAKDGILLEQSYVQPICTPTRSALLTGRYPFTIGRQHKVLGFLAPTGLLPNATLLPESLKDVGYSTHAVGKWHLGFCHWDYTPTYRGFDTFYGIYQGMGDHYSHNSVAFRETDPVGYDFRNNEEPDFNVNGTYETYVYSSYVEDLLYSRSPEDPMFLYLAFQAVHTPLQAPDIYTEPFRYIGDEDREILLGMSYAMDDAVGTVVDALKATGHYDNSVIIFTSDNGGKISGGGYNWPLRGEKGTLWEGATRAPGFIHSPLLTKTGFISNTLLHVTDWYATLMGLAGGSAPETTDGFDQWEALTMGVESPRTSMVYNIDNVILEDNTTQTNAAIRKGEFKLIVGSPGEGSWTPPPEGIDSEGPQNNVDGDAIDVGVGELTDWTDTLLFNVIDDPEERDNIADSYPDIVQGLLEELEREISRMVPADNPPNDPRGDPKYFDNIWTPGWCEFK